MSVDIFSGGQRRHFSYHFQVANACSQNALPFANHKKCPARYGSNRKKYASLAAIAYAGII